MIYTLNCGEHSDKFIGFIIIKYLLCDDGECATYGVINCLYSIVVLLMIRGGKIKLSLDTLNYLDDWFSIQ